MRWSFCRRTEGTNFCWSIPRSAAVVGLRDFASHDTPGRLCINHCIDCSLSVASAVAPQQAYSSLTAQHGRDAQQHQASSGLHDADCQLCSCSPSKQPRCADSSLCTAFSKPINRTVAALRLAMHNMFMPAGYCAAVQLTMLVPLQSATFPPRSNSSPQ